VLARFQLRADRRLGQHFLLDPQLLAKIARAAGDLRGRTVLEVGPGPGGLTRAVLAAGAGRVIAIERDPRCVTALRELADLAGGRLEVIEADALTCDLAGLGADRMIVVANLPYNIGTALLLKWLDQIERLDTLTLMFQREVAERLAAAPGTRAYGRLSVIVQWLCEVRVVLHLPGRAFVPPPQVASSVVHLRPRPRPLAPADKPALERVVAAAFGQRRKMLRASLKSLTTDPGRLLDAAGVPATARAEDVDVAGFCRLACSYQAMAGAVTGSRGTGRRIRSDPPADDSGGAPPPGSAAPARRSRRNRC
jgi:16S rRNA (adenine1518-N6/adenine1519-N6)-dimethyltransferase